MEVICLEDEAFYALVEKVVERLKEKLSVRDDKWILPEVAMTKLGITSKTTLQKYRDEGRIRFSQTDEKRIILYDLDSINDYLEKNAKEPFHGKSR
ncbi:MAG: DNA-binding protein [Bacteroidota bacterium]